MFEHLKKLEKRYKELERLICDPAVISDEKRYKSYARELSDIRPAVEMYKEYNKLSKEKEKNIELLAVEKDAQMKQLISEEIEKINGDLARLERDIKISLIPPDKNEGKSVIVEIRAGTGGNEAAIFVADLYRMYSKFAALRNLAVEILSSSPTDLNGFREIVFMVKGRDAWKNFQFESGVHRVQRVPVTEASGRIHTSAASVAVLVEAEDVEVQIDEKDLRIDTYRSSGAGGQHVNKTDSAVRITHIPSGIVVACQEDRSQIKNRAKAMKLLKAKILDAAQKQRQSEIASLRKKQIGTGDRSEKIRTYNFPQNRVTDHRINLSIYNLPEIMEGHIGALIDALNEKSQKEKLEALAV